MALEGTLADMPLADMLEVFQAHRRSGRLMLSRDQERGMIFFGEGRLIDALLVIDLEGDHVVQAEEAILRLLDWREADFSFDADPTVNSRPRRIIHDTDWFLAAIRRTNMPRITLNSRLQPAKPIASAVGSFSLNVQEWRLVSALWPQRTLGMACVDLELAPHEILPVAESLVRRGLLSLVEEVHAPRTGSRSAEPAFPMMSVAPLKHIARSQPQSSTPEVQSHLLKAIIRRVRTL